MKDGLDSSVAFKWFVPETDSDKALRLCDDFLAGVYELMSPDVFPFEIAHALTRAERQGRIPSQQSLQLVGESLTLLPTLHPGLRLLPRAAELSSQARIGVYDCLYIALVEREQCKLVTADQRLVNLLPAQTILLSSLVLP
ncbi:MAG TPA: type II toxin-antitoxin system VapC family toxin [Pirellulales bacterium]|nr:type II toxin-antitoxin system VapC family toxin [Pirellulales bacterium]